METFNKLFTQYAAKKGFAPNSNGAMYQASLAKFMCFDKKYRDIMGPKTFENLVIN